MRGIVIAPLISISSLLICISGLQYTQVITSPKEHTNYPALYERFCEKYTPGFNTTSDYYTVDREAVARMLKAHNRPLRSSPLTKLDLEITPGQWLLCGKDGAEAPILQNTRQYDYCDSVVVTSIMGGRDELRGLPAGAVEAGRAVGTCFIAFLDDASLELNRYDTDSGAGSNRTIGGWSVVRVPPEASPFTGPRENSRIPKQLTPRLFPKARWSVWVDSKLRLLEPPIRLIEEHMFSFGAFMTLYAHNVRLSWAEEAVAIKKMKLADPGVVGRQEREYDSLGFPRDATGLADGAVIMRDHRHFLSHLVSCNWWNEYVRYPPRDQTSLYFASWLVGFKPQITSDEMKEVRAHGGSQLRKLWYNYLSDVSPAVFHIGPRCRMDYSVRRVGHARNTPHFGKGGAKGGVGMSGGAARARKRMVEAAAAGMGDDLHIHLGGHADDKSSGAAGAGEGVGVGSQEGHHVEAWGNPRQQAHPLEHLLPGN